MDARGPARQTDEPPVPADRRRPRPRAERVATAGRAYVLGVLLVVPAVLLVLLTTGAPPEALPPEGQPPAVDGARALAVARRLAAVAPDRTPGTPGGAAGTEQVRDDLRDATGRAVVEDRFTDRASGRALVNLLAVQRGASTEAIVVLAHRDTDGPGAGIVDNASGTGLLVELARGFSGPEVRARTLVWASVDAGARDGLGATRLAERLPGGLRPVAVVALDSVGAADSGLPVRFDGGGRRAEPALVRSVEAALERAAPEAPRPTTPRLLRQAVQLVAPVAVGGAQAPFVIDGVPAVQLGGSDDPGGAGPASRRRLEGVGLAVAGLLQALEEDVPTSGTGDTYLYTRGQVLDGRALGVVVAALLAGPLLLAGRLLAGGVSHRVALLPPLAAAARLVLPLAGGLAGARLAAAVGLTGDAPAAPTAGLGAVALTLAGGAVGLAAVRFVPRSRRSPEADGPPGRADWTVALVLGGLGACLALAANPFSALLLAPALHAWVLLPRLPRSGAASRLALVWLPLLLPALGVVADLRLSPLDLVGAVGSQVLPGATALGLALGLAAAILLTPVALGVSTSARAGTTRRESAATV